MNNKDDETEEKKEQFSDSRERLIESEIETG